jgi:hypothetical protein
VTNANKTFSYVKYLLGSAIASDRYRIKALQNLGTHHFARLLDALRSRLRAISLPTFPLAELLVFWGGIQHGFNGFAHNPVTYASQVRSPTLILHGKLDRWTTMAEINQIFDNLPEPKQLAIFPRTGHSLLVTADKPYWEQSVSQFLKEIK